MLVKFGVFSNLATLGLATYQISGFNVSLSVGLVAFDALGHV